MWNLTSLRAARACRKLGRVAHSIRTGEGPPPHRLRWRGVRTVLVEEDRAGCGAGRLLPPPAVGDESLGPLVPRRG
ncbi:hypothetical protein GCM10025738_21030 [Microbacterium fluvii]